MSHLTRLVVSSTIPTAALFVSAAALAQAAVVPEPSDYALGFGGMTLVFVVARNIRRARAAKLRR